MDQIKKKIKDLPDTPGIYKFFDRNRKLIYIGKSVSIKKRVASYFTIKILGPKTDFMVKQIAHIEYIKVFSEFEALLLEAELIKKYKPFFNTVAKDDKSPLYIKITADEIPLLTVARREQYQKGLFLKGPFPSAKTTREVLRIIRKIFPYCHHKNPKKPCLFVSLGLCPYPYESDQSQVSYLENVKNIKKLLSGKSKIVIRELFAKMKKLANLQKFEEAQKIKIQIENLQYILTSYHAPQEFLKQPSLVDDLVMSKLKSLQSLLNLKKIPRRIECFDISSLAGKFATGSMVVFTNGQMDKSQYRRFRIKFTTKPDDYQMLREVLERRFKNNWQTPDLIIIDGGRGQLNIAVATVNKFKLTIPVIAIAKRYEQIYTHFKILPISLPKENIERQLVEAIRNETHRFALSYHQLIRSKALLKT